MKKLVTAAGLAILATTSSAALAPGAFAQAQNGRGAGLNKVGIGYYKVPPGHQDEWLELYQKWHRPIMQENLRTGATLSSRLYAAGNHAHGVGIGANGTGISIAGAFSNISAQARATGITMQSDGSEARPRNVAWSLFIKF